MPTLTPARRRRVQLRSASREAEGYLELGMHRQALRCLQRRGQLVHSDGHACFLMGECLREMSRYDEAVFPLRRSVSLEPRPAESWLALGWCYKRTGRLDRAIDALESALRHAPEDALVRYNLACYYSLAGERLTALRQLKRALDRNPSLRGLVADESDFDPMRNDPALRMLLASVA